MAAFDICRARRKLSVYSPVNYTKRIRFMAAAANDADLWRQKYLETLAVMLALVEYLGQPDATLGGVSLILTGIDLSREG